MQINTSIYNYLLRLYRGYPKLQSLPEIMSDIKGKGLIAWLIVTFDVLILLLHIIAPTTHHRLIDAGIW